MKKIIQTIIKRVAFDIFCFLTVLLMAFLVVATFGSAL